MIEFVIALALVFWVVFVCYFMALGVIYISIAVGHILGFVLGWALHLKWTIQYWIEDR